MSAHKSSSCFADLMELRSGDLPHRASVRLENSDPVIKSRFRVGEAAAAALAAGAVAADDILRLRNGEGEPQQISVDQRIAAASLRGYKLIKVEDGPQLVPNYTLPTASFYRCRDGRFIHLQGAFPHLREGTLNLLGCGDTKEEVGAKIAQRESFELEEALAESGLCGAVIRSAEEWMDHPQGKAISTVPVIEVIKIAEGEPQLLPPAARPLGGVRVLDLTRVLAGPVSGRTMAAHGADVLHVRSPKLPSMDIFVAETNQGKFSTFLDLTRDEDATHLRDLAREADIFVQGYRGGAMEGRGFGPDTLASLRPGIIYVSLNCYGHSGPWAQRPGWEQLAQSVSGLAEEGGRPGDPRLVPAAPCDYTTGYLAACGAMMALIRRMKEGGSYHVRLSLSRTALWISAQSRCAADDVAKAARGVEEIDVRAAMTVSKTPFGRLHHLDPIIRMSATQPHWVRPSVPLGTHAPQWPA
jgi:crotonobetainyl-CoA:carnitine CoA-transferase CaiB-like acyl-CoA transferase